jgi:hypothetical protein
MAARSSIERLSGNSPVFTTPVDRASRAPASPAQAALTAKAMTLVRATLIPASAAATSSSRTARNARPYRLERRFANRTNVVMAAIPSIHASHRSGSIAPGAAGGTVVMPWSPPKIELYLSAKRGRARARIRVMPAR